MEVKDPRRKEMVSKEKGDGTKLERRGGRESKEGGAVAGQVSARSGRQ